MKTRDIIQKTFIIFLLLLLSGSTVKDVSAEVKIIKHEDAYIDASIKRDDVNYNLPKKIIIAPIYPFSSDVKLSSTDLFRGLYYYSIDKLGFNDIPFHYIVSEDGKVFLGNSGGDERKIKVEGIGDDIVLIGYLTNSFSTSFSKKSLNSLVELTTRIANKNSIDPERLSISGLSFIKNQSTKSVSIDAKEVFGGWNTDLNEIKEKLKANYSPQPRSYKVKVDEIKPLKENIKPGETVEIEMKITNLESTGLYGGTDSQIILTRVGENFSSFYLNGEWLSQTQFAIMDEEEILLPYEQATFTFRVKAPLYVGERKEEFELKTIDGTKIEVGNVNIVLNMSTPDRPIVEIQNTETGVLNVRSDASSVSSVVTQVIPGERFFQISDAGNGYVEIDLGNGTSGWVSTRYISYISQ